MNHSMNHNSSPTPGFDALAQANPVADESLTDIQQRRKAKTLELITGRSSSPLALKAVAAVGLIALAGLSLPLLSNQPAVASAEEVLTQAADSSLAKESAAETATSVGFIQREDSTADGTITSVYKVDAGGMITTQSTTSGHPTFSIPELTDPEQLARATTSEQLRSLAGNDTVRGLLTLLLNPYLTGAQQKMIYEDLSSHEDNQVISESDDSVTISNHDLTFTVIPSTGQLTAATGLVGEGVNTVVAATAVLGCVNVEGLQGPDSITTACADSNYTVHDIRWDTWGDNTAVGHGTAWINDCAPFCADGTFHTYPVTVTVRDKQQCGYQADIYSKLDIEYEDRAMNETFEIGCV